MPRRTNAMKDLSDAVEALTATAAMLAREGDFYRRSGEATTHEAVKAAFLEVADDLGRSHARLESSRGRLGQALAELEAKARSKE